MVHFFTRATTPLSRTTGVLGQSPGRERRVGHLLKGGSANGRGDVVEPHCAGIAARLQVYLQASGAGWCGLIDGQPGPPGGPGWEPRRGGAAEPFVVGVEPAERDLRGTGGGVAAGPHLGVPLLSRLDWGDRR